MLRAVPGQPFHASLFLDRKNPSYWASGKTDTIEPWRLSLCSLLRTPVKHKMKRTLILGIPALAILTAVGIHSIHDNTLRYQPRTVSGEAQGIRGAWEYLSMVRSNIYTGQVEIEDIQRTRKAYAAYAKKQRKSLGLQWSEMGPDNIGGRIRSIVADPTDANKIWTGGVSGGLWRSFDAANTWEKVTSFDDNMVISTIDILGNGHIYVGTGNSFENPSGTGGSGFIGYGLFRSTDNGASWSLVEGPSSPWNTNVDWTVTNKIVADPTNPNRLWVAYDDGLKLYDETTSTFTSPSGVPSGQICRALEVSPDGQTILANFGQTGYLSTDGGQSFNSLSSGTGFPQNGIGRMEFAISPDDSNYMYTMCASSSGRMLGVWASTDRGNNWTRIWPPGFGSGAVPALDIFRDNSQGIYDNVLSVPPGIPTEVWLGGVELWKTSIGGQPQQLALAFDFPGCFSCVHADVHEITWVDNVVYIGCDGGVYKGEITGTLFYAANRHLNLTQFYSNAYSPQGDVIGGTQDNGSLIINYSPSPNQDAFDLTGGDGFDVDISQIDPTIMFTTIYSGLLYRSNDGGINFSEFYDARLGSIADFGNQQGGLGDFYTNIRLYEDYNDTGSQDSSDVVNLSNTTFNPGDTITYYGRVPAVPQFHVLTETWAPDDTIRLQDKVQSLFALAGSGSQGVWVTRDAINFIDSVQWWKVIDNIGGNVNCMEWSVDGHHLFVGRSDGAIVRISNFDQAYTYDQADVSGDSYVLQTATISPPGSGPITGLAPDPNNPNRLMATRGGYGGSGKVYITNNATGTPPTWTNLWTTSSIDAGLVGMPVYDGIIHKGDPNILVVGTEMGMFSSTDGGQNWEADNMGMDPVPVFAVRQQQWDYQNNPYYAGYVTNPGVIYAGTHGRGMFRTETLLSTGPIPAANTSTANNLTIFPNPAVDNSTIRFELSERSEVVLTVYDLSGKVVSALGRRVLPAGAQQVTLPVGELTNGTYIVELRHGDKRRTGRFVVSR